MAVGRKLDKIIKQKNLTQKEVADKAGIKPQTLNNLITRDSARADVQILLKICKALNIEMSVFAEDAIEEFYLDHPDAEPIIKETHQELTENEQIIVGLFKELTDTQQGEIIGRAKVMVEQNETKYNEEGAG